MSDVQLNSPPRDGTLDSAVDALAAVDEHFGALALAFRDSLAQDQAGDELRLLASISSLAALEELDELGRLIDLAAEQSAATPARVLEAILLTAPFCGLLQAARAARVFADRHPDHQGEAAADHPPGENVDGFLRPALEAGAELYGLERAKANIAMFRLWGREVADVVEQVVYGGLNRRPVLTHLEREACGSAALACLSREFSFRWHARVALVLGITPAELQGLLFAQIPYTGFPRMLEALNQLDEVIAAWSDATAGALAWDPEPR